MYYSCTCPNCGYHYTPPSVPLNLDWTQWQDITWYDDQGQPLTYPKSMLTLTPTRKALSSCVIEPSSTVSSVPDRTGKPSLPNSQTTVHSWYQKMLPKTTVIS